MRIDLYKGDCLEVIYNIKPTIESIEKCLSFTISISELESDASIYEILERYLEEYIQDNYCTCSFNENKNYCDCDTDYLWDYDFKRIGIIARIEDAAVKKGLFDE